MAEGIPGTQGYADQADDLFTRYESIAFDDAHALVLHLLPSPPADVLDIGSGTGRDAAHLAGLGHRVVAVEPTDKLRLMAIRRHASPSIDWVDDALPDLRTVLGLGRAFDLVMMTAVWMHLEPSERRTAMPIVGGLVRPGGKLILSLRHGPVPAGRRMFAVTAAETIDLAAASGLVALLHRETESAQEHNRRAGITWTRLAFEKQA